MATQPDDEPTLGRFLDAQLKAGELFVRDDIFARYVPLLLSHVQRVKLRSNLFSVTVEDLEEIVSTSLANYLTKPQRYDPVRGKSLLGYLKMDAEGDLLNLVDRHRRSFGRNVPLEDERRNREVAVAAEFEAAADDEIDTAQVVAKVMALAETDEERTVLRLMIDGERQTAVFALALGLTHLPEREQTTTVQQIKDRLDKRRRRRFPEGWQDGHPN